MTPHFARSHGSVFGFLIGIAAAWPVKATEAPGADPSQICEWVAQQASRAEGVPLTVLAAISLNETGRKRDGQFRPWPWTVNMEGAGHWFDSRDAALDFALKEFERGARSFDVGCFQINYKYHGQHFASVEEMFDPLANALYAARFLKELYAEKGDWNLAAGAYHSRTPEFADRYAARFQRFRDGLDDTVVADIPEIPEMLLAGLVSATPEPRVNNYPLLQAGGGAGLASLVPIGNGGGVMLFGSPATPAEVAVE